MSFNHMTKLPLALACCLLVTTTAGAAADPKNPWDDTTEKAVPSAPSVKAARDAKPAAKAAPVAAATSTKQAASKSTAAVAPKASPFGAPVPSQTVPMKWGEPIVLTPAKVAIAPASAASAPAGSASAPVVAAIPVTAPAVQAAPVLVAAIASPVQAEATPEVSWKLVRGIALHTQLQKWATTAGWQLEWKLNRSWVVPADVKLTGTFDQALEQVINALAGEGKPINLVLWEGNHVAEINETAAR